MIKEWSQFSPIDYFNKIIFQNMFKQLLYSATN